jgi:hypothetical protein
MFSLHPDFIKDLNFLKVFQWLYYFMFKSLVHLEFVLLQGVKQGLTLCLSRWLPSCCHLWSNLSFPHWYEHNVIYVWISCVHVGLFLDFLFSDSLLSFGLRGSLILCPKSPKTQGRQFLLSRQNPRHLWWLLLGKSMLEVEIAWLEGHGGEEIPPHH